MTREDSGQVSNKAALATHCRPTLRTLVFIQFSFWMQETACPQIATTDSVTIVNGFSAAAPAIDRSDVAAEVAEAVAHAGTDQTAAAAVVG
jgi:hypothetical protein